MDNPEPTNEALEALPSLLQDVARAAGLGTALTLCGVLGGSKVHIAKQPGPKSLLARAVGVPAARKIGAALGPGHYDVPLGPTSDHRRRHGEIEKLLAKGLAVQEISRRLHVHYRTVQRHKQRRPDTSQMDLFPPLDRTA